MFSDENQFTLKKEIRERYSGVSYWTVGPLHQFRRNNNEHKYQQQHCCGSQLIDE